MCVEGIQRSKSESAPTTTIFSDRFPLLSDGHLRMTYFAQTTLLRKNEGISPQKIMNTSCSHGLCSLFNSSSPAALYQRNKYGTNVLKRIDHAPASEKPPADNLGTLFELLPFWRRAVFFPPPAGGLRERVFSLLLVLEAVAIGGIPMFFPSWHTSPPTEVDENRRCAS